MAPKPRLARVEQVLIGVTPCGGFGALRRCWAPQYRWSAMKGPAHLGRPLQL